MMRDSIDAVVANCRRHGDDWAVAVALMFRTHMAIDTPGGFAGIDDDLAELRELGRRVGDRWMRAQVAGAAAEAAMMRGLPELARSAYEEALQLAREVGAHQRGAVPHGPGRRTRLPRAETWTPPRSPWPRPPRRRTATGSATPFRTSTRCSPPSPSTGASPPPPSPCASRPSNSP